MTYEEIEERVKEDFSRVVGKVVFPMYVVGYTANDDTSDFLTNGLYPFVVDPSLSPEDLMHGDEEWVDPYWDLHPLLPDELPEELHGVRSFWIHGHSYSLHGKVERTSTRFCDSYRPS